MTSVQSEWTAGSSTAAFVRLLATYRSAFLSPAQTGLLQWELEKFGPRYDEPPPDVLIRNGVLGLRSVAVLGIREVALLHGREIARLRGREALDRALMAAARVAADNRAITDDVAALLFDVSKRAVEPSLSCDTIDKKASHPTEAEFLHQLELAANLVTRPFGWTRAHALGFLLHVAHTVDRETVEPLCDIARLTLAAAGLVFANTHVDVLLAHGEALYERCEGHRWVLFRAVEDQLMHFVRSTKDVRTAVVDVLRASVGTTTADQRALVTTASAMLGTHPRARYRERQCPEWPTW